MASITSGASGREGRLGGRVCIVTGGMRGFGASIVELFSTHGARVLVLDLLTPQPGFYEASATTLTPAKAETNVYAVKADITSRQSWTDALHTAKSTFGAIPTIVVNNAGWTYSNKPTLQVSEAEFDRVFEINVKSIYLSTDVLLPAMLEAKVDDACFVNVSSTAAIRPRPKLVWYNASKGAVSTATKALAVEYAPYKVRFNIVSPVAGNTPLLSKFAGSAEAGDAMAPEQLAQFNASIPIGRLSEGSDIANACLFLADPASNFLTGIDIPVDGGRCV